MYLSNFLMFNSQEHQSGGMMGPRISFSCDFVTDNTTSGGSTSANRDPVDPSAPDFEFSPLVDTARRPLIAAADELFYKGRLLPLKDQCAQMQRMTLRDELQAVDEDQVDDASRHPPRPTPKSPIRWKGLLGRRRAATATVHKKHDGKTNGSDQTNGGGSSN